MTGGCLIIHGTLDNSSSFQHHSDITNGRNADHLSGILTMKANYRAGIRTDSVPFLHQNSLGQSGRGGGGKMFQFEGEKHRQ